LGRFGFICAPSTSRGHAVERAFHLLLNALDGPTADATLPGNLQDALASAQLRLDARFSMAGLIRKCEHSLLPRFDANKSGFPKHKWVAFPNAGDGKTLCEEHSAKRGDSNSD
jgi:hypothetical protein